jgi:hypothetical protein
MSDKNGFRQGTDGRRRGRPRKATSRSNRLEVRLDDNDMTMIDQLLYLDEGTKSDVLRKALKTYFYIRTNGR